MLDGPVKRKLLIVEDDEALLKVLGDRFVEEDYHVLTATNGEKGLDLATQENPDVILLDILMPKMDGMTMMKKLKDLPGKKSKIILLTNVDPDEELLQQIVEDPPAYYLVKSNFSLEDVVEKVRKVMVN